VRKLRKAAWRKRIDGVHVRHEEAQANDEEDPDSIETFGRYQRRYEYKTSKSFKRRIDRSSMNYCSNNLEKSAFWFMDRCEVEAMRSPQLGADLQNPALFSFYHS